MEIFTAIGVIVVVLLAAVGFGCIVAAVIEEEKK